MVGLIISLLNQICQETYPPSTFPVADKGTEKIYYDVDGDKSAVTVYYSSNYE